MSADVDAPPEDATIWRQVHPATPLINAWKALGVLVAVVAFNALDQIGEALEFLGTFPLLAVIGVIVAVLLVVLLVALLYSWLAWKRMRYAVGEDAVFHHQGILFRSQRHARLNRIQGVDIIRPLLGRLVGLSVVNIETAGGAKSNVRIQYLTDAEAERLRAEVLARAAGLRATSRPGAGPGEAPEFSRAPERPVYALGTGDLVLSLLLSPWALGLVIAVALLVPLAFVADAGWAALGVIPGVLAFAGMFFSVFDSSFNFTLAVSPDGLRTRHGLLSTRAQTLPPGRIQAVRVTQYLLWRAKDWWRVDVNVAGYGTDTDGGGSGSSSRTVLIPVGTRTEATGALWLVLHDLGVDDPDAVVAAALTGTLDDGGFLHSPASARWVDPIAWRRNGLLITRTALLMRHGRLSRTLLVVPHERTQSLAIQQGPWERRLGLADLRADSVPGPVRPVAAHLPADTAGRILFDQAGRASMARAKEGPEEWMRRVGVSEPAPLVPPSPGAPSPGPPPLLPPPPGPAS